MLLVCRRRGCLRYSVMAAAIVLTLYCTSLVPIFLNPFDALTLDNFLFKRTFNMRPCICDDMSSLVEDDLENLQSDSKWRKGMGSIDVYQWAIDDFCLSTVQDLYWNPLYPKYPSSHMVVGEINDELWVSEFAIRRYFFYVRPTVSGGFLLRLGVAGGVNLRLCEFSAQLSTHYEVRCFEADTITASGFSSYTSKPLNLKTGSTYLVDVMHWVKSSGKLKLLWKPPGQMHFSVITGVAASAMSNNSSKIASLSPSISLDTARRRIVLSDPRRNFFNLPQLKMKEIAELPVCDYEPSYLINGSVEEYTGLWQIREGNSYPSYHIFCVECMNNSLAQDVAKSVARKVMQIINERSLMSRSFSLERIVFMEENKETKAGHRYFVELDLKDEHSGSKCRLSDYFHISDNASEICLPKGFIWQQNSVINVIFTTSSNQGKWVLLTLDYISKIVHDTGDFNIHIIVANFGTVGIDFDKEFRRRNLNYTVLHIPGKFNKVKGINKAARTITDDNSIVFTIDLHLQVPIFLFDEVRKNTIIGRTVYAPVLVRLPCGKHVEYTDDDGAVWVLDGFGVLSMYKRDWDIVGGMNEKRYGEKWGGEDWDIIDRIISKHYEVIQRRLPGYYHIYHSRKGSAWYDDT